MSNKATCPGCDSHTSSIWNVLYGDDWEDKCPVCGLSVDAMREVIAVRRSSADKELREKYEAVVKRADTAENEARELRQVVDSIRQALGVVEVASRSGE